MYVCPCGGARLTVGESPTLGREKVREREKKEAKSKRKSFPPPPLSEKQSWAICPKLPAVANERESRCRSLSEWWKRKHALGRN